MCCLFTTVHIYIDCMLFGRSHCRLFLVFFVLKRILLLRLFLPFDFGPFFSSFFLLLPPAIILLVSCDILVILYRWTRALVIRKKLHFLRWALRVFDATFFFLCVLLLKHLCRFFVLVALSCFAFMRAFSSAGARAIVFVDEKRGVHIPSRGRRT